MERFGYRHRWKSYHQVSLFHSPPVSQLSLLCVVTSFSSIFQAAREVGCQQLQAYIICFRNPSGKRPLSPNVYISLVEKNSHRPCLGHTPTPILTTTLSGEWSIKTGWACAHIGSTREDLVLEERNSMMATKLRKIMGSIVCYHSSLLSSTL